MSWRANPIRNRILVALLKRKGEIIDDDLTRLIQKNDQSVSSKNVEKELMNLEIAGVVSISQITRTRKRVKLINKETLNPSLFTKEDLK
ncbi:hypothetical protein GF325_10890 [Candidatus Bathyarchaeota archaeon]|nr:hypothetical protein [Candidatus Bathyarchaeota archaeon]